MYIAQFTQIDGQDICTSVTQTNGIELGPEHMQIDSLDISLLGQIRVNGLLSPPLPAPVRFLTKVQYLKRFTQPERLAIEAAAVTVPELRDYIKLLDAVTTEGVNLDDPDVVKGHADLDAAGLLAAGRSAEILA